MDGKSPLRDATEESMRGADVELQVAVVGLDGTTFQTLHARHRYLPEEFRFGERFADMLSQKPDGRLQLDYARLHDTVPAPV
jgi:inward rectifier potassium channel